MIENLKVYNEPDAGEGDLIISGSIVFGGGAISDKRIIRASEWLNVTESPVPVVAAEIELSLKEARTQLLSKLSSTS